MPRYGEFTSTLPQSSGEQVPNSILQWCHSYAGNTWVEASGELGYSVIITNPQHQLHILPLQEKVSISSLQKSVLLHLPTVSIHISDPYQIILRTTP
mmetsp:Transcript_22347/g.28516  ORF Transcript_22347/g.28516 Transcript_22347/m.28516 type:complete len:97 (-) Transcript_22347:1247-1537(-)